MGGSSSKKPAGTAAVTPEDQQLAMRNIPAFMPGQQSLLAQQLAAGGYGTQPAWDGILGGMYQNMNAPVINGSADIAKLRKKLDAQGIKADAGSKK